jgi:hypothetical protein
MHIVATSKSLENGIARTRLGRPLGSTGSQIERNKHRLASLVLLGWRNGRIARELGVSSRTIRTWLNHPEVQEAIRELEGELHRSTERLHAGLLRTSMRRKNKIIRQGEGKVALAARARRAPRPFDARLRGMASSCPCPSRSRRYLGRTLTHEARPVAVEVRAGRRDVADARKFARLPARYVCHPETDAGD